MNDEIISLCILNSYLDAMLIIDYYGLELSNETSHGMDLIKLFEVKDRSRVYGIVKELHFLGFQV